MKELLLNTFVPAMEYLNTGANSLVIVMGIFSAIIIALLFNIITNRGK